MNWNVSRYRGDWKAIAKVVSVGLAVLVGAWLIYSMLSLAIDRQADVERLDASKVERSELTRQLGTQSEQLAKQEAVTTALAEQIEQLGEEPVVEPPTAVTPPSQRYVAIPGPRGPGPTVRQIDRGVERFCAPRDDCVGDDGTDGAAGAAGAPGQDGADGADAPTVDVIECQGGLTPMSFTFVFSDGSAIEVECQMLPPVDPPEEPVDEQPAP